MIYRYIYNVFIHCHQLIKMDPVTQF